MNKLESIAAMNDRLRRTLPIGKLNIQMSDVVSTSPDRSKIVQAIKKYDQFDPELDVNKDHSVGLVVVNDNAYIFRFTYGDERYDYSIEVGQRTLAIMHSSEFRSIKLGRRIQTSIERALAT